MRIAIYDRLSTGKEDPENQAAQLHNFTQTQQSWAITHGFTDVVSGTKGEKERPQFKRMIEAASEREFDLMLFWAPGPILPRGRVADVEPSPMTGWLPWRGDLTPSSTLIRRHLQGSWDPNHGDRRQAGEHPEVLALRHRVAKGAAQRPQAGAIAGQQREDVADDILATAVTD